MLVRHHVIGRGALINGVKQWMEIILWSFGSTIAYLHYTFYDVLVLWCSVGSFDNGE